MKNYDVIIIGAGPSGIFCAYELIHANKDLKILMIEKGRRIENRQCPKRKTKVCVAVSHVPSRPDLPEQEHSPMEIIFIPGRRWKSSGDFRI